MNKLSEKQLTIFAEKILYAVEEEFKNDKPFGIDDGWKDEIAAMTSTGCEYCDEEATWDDVHEAIKDVLAFLRKNIK